VETDPDYIWNRLWTFQTRQARLLSQSSRAVAVSTQTLGVGQLFLLMLVTAGAHHLAAQAVAILLVTPFSFAANKHWAFADDGRPHSHRCESRRDRIVGYQPRYGSPGSERSRTSVQTLPAPSTLWLSRLCCNHALEPVKRDRERTPARNDSRHADRLACGNARLAVAAGV
jgi:putative flippase GtrA